MCKSSRFKEATFLVSSEQIHELFKANARVKSKQKRWEHLLSGANIYDCSKFINCLGCPLQNFLDPPLLALDQFTKWSEKLLKQILLFVNKWLITQEITRNTYIIYHVIIKFLLLLLDTDFLKCLLYVFLIFLCHKHF